MEAQETTYHTAHPTTGAPVVLKMDDADARWALWSGQCDGRGLRYFGVSTQEHASQALKEAWSLASDVSRHAVTPLVPVSVMSF